MKPTDENGAVQLSTATHLEDDAWRHGDTRHPPGLTVLWHPDVRRVGERASLAGLASGRDVRLSRLEPAFVAPDASTPDASTPRPLDDPHLSRKPLVLSSCDAGEIVLRRGESRTEVRVGRETVHDEARIARDRLEDGVVLLLADRVVLLLHRLDPLSEPDLPRHGLVGEHPRIVRLCRDIRQVADLDVPVLVRGETGTGKELVAGAVHRAGPRRDGPYVALNLAGVPASMAAAELFGAAKGAYTGADRDRPGYFERAGGGTLFLDEIGEVPADVQVLLLRALETGEIQPVGAEAPRRSDARLVSATDADLEAEVAAGRFREPLLHRLAGFVLEIPPLRRRREDFGRLLAHFLHLELERLGESDRLDPPGPGRPPWMPAPLVALLARHPWPGNVRQLRNVVRELVIGSRGEERVRLRPSVERLLDEVGRDASRSSTLKTESTKTADDGETAPPDRRPDEIPAAELRSALRLSRWRPYAAARRLGIPRASIYDLIAKSPDLHTAADLERDEIETARERLGGRDAVSVDDLAEELEVSALGLRRRMGELGLDG